MHPSIPHLLRIFKRGFIRSLRSDLILPVLLLISYIIFLLLAKGVVPTADELINSFGEFYAKYGYEIIFISSFLEALILVNLFVPGMFAMAMGVIFARAGQIDFIAVVAAVFLGASLGYMVDFLLGYFGFSDILKTLGYENFITAARQQIKKFGRRGLIWGFIHSNIASFLALTAGTIRMDWWRFFTVAVLSTLVWTIIWSFVIYLLGDIVLFIIRKYSFLLILLFIGVMILMRIWKKEEERS